MNRFSFLLNNSETMMFQGRLYIGDKNSFYPLDPGELEEAESLLGQRFPDQLREFYQQIGYGNLTTPYNPPEGYSFCNTNEILSPSVVAHLGRGELEWEGQEYWMSEATFELLQPGDLPFFEVADSNYFMVLKPHLDNPNAVYTDTNIKIENSLERFIWRLYYESPWFFDDIVKAHYANQDASG